MQCASRSLGSRSWWFCMLPCSCKGCAKRCDPLCHCLAFTLSEQFLKYEAVYVPHSIWHRGCWFCLAVIAVLWVPHCKTPVFTMKAVYDYVFLFLNSAIFICSLEEAYWVTSKIYHCAEVNSWMLKHEKHLDELRSFILATKSTFFSAVLVTCS